MHCNGSVWHVLLFDRMRVSLLSSLYSNGWTVSATRIINSTRNYNWNVHAPFISITTPKKTASMKRINFANNSVDHLLYPTDTRHAPPRTRIGVVDASTRYSVMPTFSLIPRVEACMIGLRSTAIILSWNHRLAPNVASKYLRTISNGLWSRWIRQRTLTRVQSSALTACPSLEAIIWMVNDAHVTNGSYQRFTSIAMRLSKEPWQTWHRTIPSDVLLSRNTQIFTGFNYCECMCIGRIEHNDSITGNNLITVPMKTRNAYRWLRVRPLMAVAAARTEGVHETRPESILIKTATSAILTASSSAVRSMRWATIGRSATS